MTGVLRNLLLTTCALTLASAQEPDVAPKPMIRRLFLTVASLDRSIEFYGNLIGLVELNTKRFRMNEQIAALYGAPGVAMDIAGMKLPAGDATLAFIEYGSTRRGGTLPELQDAGAVRVILSVQDLPLILRRLDVARLKNLLSEATDKPRVALVRDPDGFFVELNQVEHSSGTSPNNIVGVRLGITVRNADDAVRMYRDAFSCQAQTGDWRPTNEKHADIANLVGGQYRRTTCVLPRGNYDIEFIEFRHTRTARPSVQRSLQEPGAANLEILVAKSAYDDTVRSLRSHGAEFVVRGGPVVEISGRRSVILRSPDHVFVEPRSTSR